MAIDTAEKRRSVIDFAGIRGTGMPIPKASIDMASRIHIQNLYVGYPSTSVSAAFWRKRVTATSLWKNRKTNSRG